MSESSESKCAETAVTEEPGASGSGAPPPNPPQTSAAAPEDGKPKLPALTRRQKRFVEEYLKDLNGAHAVMRAGCYKTKRPARLAYKLMRRPQVRAAIEAGKEARSERCQITGDMLVQHWYWIGTGDANEVSEYRRGCCRHCWGVDFKRQEKPSEREARYAAYLREQLHKQAKGSDSAPEPFDELGGLGFNPNRKPNLDCPECHGDGEGRPFFHDTRYLSPEGRALYGGVKVTESGKVELKTHSKEKALEMVGRLIGAEVKKHELTGKDGTPLSTGPVFVIAREEADQIERDLDDKV